jgi:hypothetical protein
MKAGLSSFIFCKLSVRLVVFFKSQYGSCGSEGPFLKRRNCHEEVRVYSGRVARGNRYYWNFDRPIVTCGSSRAGGSAPGPMYQQFETDWARLA